MRRLLPLLVFFTAASASAQEVGERYDYEVHWGYSDVAHVTLQRGCPRDGYVPAKLSAKSQGVAEQLHAFHIKLDSFVAPAGQTLEGRTFIEEEGQPRKYRSRFADTGVVFTQKSFKKKESTLRLNLKPGTYDLLSWFFALRGESLTEGSSHNYYVWDGWKLSEVAAVVGDVERIWTPNGTFEARRVSLTRTRLHHASSEVYKPKAEVEQLGTIWFTEDELRAPIAMDFRAPVGMAKLRLTRRTSTTCR